MPLMWLFGPVLASVLTEPGSANSVRNEETSDTDDPPLVGIEWFAVQGRKP